MQEAPIWPDRVEECRLERADGSVWSVEALEPDGLRIRVTARREAGSTPPERLEDVLLVAGDVIRWLAADGEVLWALRVPAGPGASDPGDQGGRPGTPGR